jgi:hypothetical protein
VGNSLSDPLSIFKHAADVKLGTIQLFWQSAPFYARHAAALSAEESECGVQRWIRRVTPLGLRLHHPTRSHGARAEFQRTADTLICLYSKQAKLMA